MESRGSFGRLVRRVVRGLWPTRRLSWTREGAGYIAVVIGLLLTGLYQQINLILLVAGLAAGPIFASFVVSAAMLRRLRVTRRVPAYVFSGDPLVLDYNLENGRAWSAALALFVEDDIVPTDRALAGVNVPTPRVFFARVPVRDRARGRWQGPSPRRVKYRFRAMDIVTRSPFGLLERRVTIESPDQWIVYPTVGQLGRRWHLAQRQATEDRRSQRHDRSARLQEYHGLRDYRPGDSPRRIHWRTSARIGKPMIKEFEQQNDQDLAVLLDPWLPRGKVTPEQREALEQAVRFAATVFLETCRRQGRRLLLGWTGPTPGLRRGPASVKLLHDLLEELAVIRSSAEGTLSALLDARPPATLRESILIVVSTRPINLIEEAERSARLSGASARGRLGRVLLLDASRGDLTDLVKYAESPATNVLSLRDAKPGPPDRQEPNRPGLPLPGGDGPRVSQPARRNGGPP